MCSGTGNEKKRKQKKKKAVEALKLSTFDRSVAWLEHGTLVASARSHLVRSTLLLLQPANLHFTANCRSLLNATAHCLPTLNSKLSKNKWITSHRQTSVAAAELLTRWFGWPKKWQILLCLSFKTLKSDTDTFFNCCFSKSVQRCKSKAVVFWHSNHLRLHWSSRTYRITFTVFIVVLCSWILPCEMWGTQTRATAVVVWTNRFTQGWVSLAVKWHHGRLPPAPYFVWMLIMLAEKPASFFLLFVSFVSTEHSTSAH